MVLTSENTYLLTMDSFWLYHNGQESEHISNIIMKLFPQQGFTLAIPIHANATVYLNLKIVLTNC